MKVKELMTRTVGTCAPEESLAAAVTIMWEQDCGAVPVVRKSKPIGVITDRDVAIALTLGNRLAVDIVAGELVDRKVVSCRPNDTVETALKRMSKNRVRRLVVVDKQDQLKGMISVADVLTAASADKKLLQKALRALQAISRPHKTASKKKCKKS